MKSSQPLSLREVVAIAVLALSIGVASSSPLLALIGPHREDSVPLRLDLGSCSRAELSAVSGIGPVLAGRILESGREPSLLLGVPGIGQKQYRTLLDALRDDQKEGRR